MYERFLQAAKRHLFFQALNSHDEALLFAGDANIRAPNNIELEPRVQHLTCFAGGMIALAAKLFDRQDDLVQARQLVDGCIWAYRSMPAGIMPEIFYAAPCHNNTDCVWNQKRWYDAVRERLGIGLDDKSLWGDERIEAWIKKNRLVPGFMEIRDGRYLLRYLNHNAPTKSASWLKTSQARSH